MVGPTVYDPVERSVRPARSSPVWHVLAGAVGNVLEWYDFAAYGYFAAIIGKNFFPSASPIVSVASAFGVFAAAFLMRPIGGAFFGHIGDRLGRKKAMLTSALLMTLSTVAMGLLPTYTMVGAAAPLLLVGLRLLQGLSVGGEYTTSIVFLVEQAQPHRRGVIGSMAGTGATSGILLGSAVGAIASSCLTQGQLEAWGWRVPFLLGVLLGGAAFALRRVLADDTIKAGSRGGRLPLAEAFASDWRSIVRSSLALAFFAASFYLIFVYLVTMMQQVDGLTARRALEINTASMFVVLLATPMFGAVSDRLGRKPVLLSSVIGGIVLSVPAFWLIATPNSLSILAGQVIFALLIAAWCGPMEALLVELFASRTRCTALSISYNIVFALLGGTAPIVGVYLVSREKLDLGPAYYLIALAVVSLIGLLSIPDRTAQPLR
jgi:MFS transporter, MHS family, proline/betaine transporter